MASRLAELEKQLAFLLNVDPEVLQPQRSALGEATQALSGLGTGLSSVAQGLALAKEREKQKREAQSLEELFGVPTQKAEQKEIEAARKLFEQKMKGQIRTLPTGEILTSPTGEILTEQFQTPITARQTALQKLREQFQGIPTTSTLGEAKDLASILGQLKQKTPSGLDQPIEIDKDISKATGLPEGTQSTFREVNLRINLNRIGRTPEQIRRLAIAELSARRQGKPEGTVSDIFVGIEDSEVEQLSFGNINVLEAFFGRGLEQLKPTKNTTPTPSPKPSPSVKFKTAKEVGEAFRAGQISEGEARQILRKDFNIK